MKQFGLLLLFLGVFTTGFSGNIAILISLNGEGYVHRGGSKEPLKVPLTFQENDEVSVFMGSAVIMYYSGNEVVVNAGETYIIKKSVSENSETVFLAMEDSGTSKSLLAQSGNIYGIRGMKNIFPAKSKIAPNDKIILINTFENAATLRLSITIKENKFQKEVWSEVFEDTILVIDSISLETGKSYHWNVSGTPRNIPELGTLVVEARTGSPIKTETKLDYLNAITMLYREDYVCKALELCIEARKKYPEITIFNILYENLLF